MRILSRIALIVFVGVIAVIAIALIRTLMYRAPGEISTAEVRVVRAVPAVDVDAAAQRLSGAIQIQTVSHQNPADDQPGEWDRLAGYLQGAYPAAHAAMTREVVGRRSLVYTWKGSDPSLAPIVLMAHQDVVPVTPGTEAQWKHPPFAGEIADGAVWGRGSVDDKGSLIALFEGLEALARSGFTPRRTVIVVSGEDEEARGSGAKAAAELLARRGTKAQFVLDEGLAEIADDPVTHNKLAMIGTAEKGYATMVVTAKAAGGHSSAPPADGGGVVTLAKAVAAISDHGFPLRFKGPGVAVLQQMAPHASFPMRLAIANPWLFRPLLLHRLGASPSGAALLHTTIAPTMVRASPKENVLPQDPQAWINYRIAPGDSSAMAMARAKAATAGLPVTLAWAQTPVEPSLVSSTASPGWKVIAAVARNVTGAPVSPGLVTAGTDSRNLQAVADDVYRFEPVDLSLKEVEMIHGTNEHMTLQNLKQAIDFYAQLIATAAS